MDTNALRAGIISLASSLFPVLNLIGVTDLTADGISAIMLVITNALTILFLIWKVKPETTTKVTMKTKKTK